MIKLTAQGSSQNRNLNLRFIKVKGEDKLDIIMIKIGIKIGIAQTVEIGDCHIEVELSVDKTIEEGHSMIQIEVILEDEILEEHKIIQDQNFRGGDRGSFRNDIFGRGRSRPRERQYLGNFRRNE